MDKVSGKLTVFFEEPFWVGVFERVSGGSLSVCKVTFGAEPKDYEIYEFVLKNYYRLRFSPAVANKFSLLKFFIGNPLYDNSVCSFIFCINFSEALENT